MIRPEPAERACEAASERARRLQAEARDAAFEHIGQLMKALERVVAHAADVAAHDLHSPGQREVSRRLSEDAQSKLATLQAMIDRLRPPQSPR